MAGELLYAETQGDPNKLWMGDVSICTSAEFRSARLCCYPCQYFKLVFELKKWLVRTIYVSFNM